MMLSNRRRGRRASEDQLTKGALWSPLTLRLDCLNKRSFYETIGMGASIRIISIMRIEEAREGGLQMRGIRARQIAFWESRRR
jgi:hypothetical protein